MHSPINLYNRQDKLTAERCLLERLEIILQREFIGGYSGPCEDIISGTSDSELEDAYSFGVQDVKDYLCDALEIYVVERSMYREK